MEGACAHLRLLAEPGADAHNPARLAIGPRDGSNRIAPNPLVEEFAAILGDLGELGGASGQGNG